MDTQLAFRLIREQEKEEGLSTIHLWGGEPFLHPDVDAIVAEVFGHYMNLMITTNGFWGTTAAEASAKLAGINGMKSSQLYFELILSCDWFHQSQPATPIENIANILKAAIEINDDHFVTLVHSCNLANDGTLNGLFPLLAPHITPDAHKLAKLDTGHSVDFYFKGNHPLVSIVNGPVDLSVGKAKDLAPELRGSEPLKKDEVFRDPRPIFDDRLYVDVEGDIFLNSHNIGGKIFPIGNIVDSPLASVIKTAKNDPMIRALQTMPFRHVLFPFRKYLDIDPILEQSHSIFELFNRLYLAEAVRDKKEELQHARSELQRGGLTNSDVLLPIRLYGDLTDCEPLMRVFTDKERSLNERWEAAFVFLSIFGHSDDFFAESYNRIRVNPLSNTSTLFHSCHGKGKVEDMGQHDFPDWYEKCEY
jgi:hypothetical protein